MMQIIEIVRMHAQTYARMQPRDVVKLVYQNEFGGGHMIANAQDSLRRIREEYAQTPRDPHTPLCEMIGNGLVRVSLAALDTNVYPLTQLNQDFVRSAARNRGDRAHFLAKLDALCAQFDTLGLGFDSNAFCAYLDTYRAQSCPMVSHSEIYARVYHPAYRVVLEEFVHI